MESQVHEPDAERPEPELHRGIRSERLALEHERELGRARRHGQAHAVAGLALAKRIALLGGRGLEALVRDLDPVLPGCEVGENEGPVGAARSGALDRSAGRRGEPRHPGAVGEPHRAGEARGLDQAERHLGDLAAADRHAAGLAGAQPGGFGRDGPEAGGEPGEAGRAVAPGEERGGRRPVAFPPRLAALALDRDPRVHDRRVAVRELDLDRSRPVERDHELRRALRRGDLPGADDEIGVALGAHRERVPAVGRDALELELALAAGDRAKEALAPAGVRELDPGLRDRHLGVGVDDLAADPAAIGPRGGRAEQAGERGRGKKHGGRHGAGGPGTERTAPRSIKASHRIPPPLVPAPPASRPGNVDTWRPRPVRARRCAAPGAGPTTPCEPPRGGMPPCRAA